MPEIHFEVHTLKSGKWSMASVYPDQETAMVEASHLGNSKFVSDVKVYKVNFNQDTGQFTQKLIHRQSRLDQFDDIVLGGGGRDLTQDELIEQRRARLNAKNEPPETPAAVNPKTEKMFSGSTWVAIIAISCLLFAALWKLKS